MFILDKLKPTELELYLKGQGQLGLEDHIENISIPGAGNMNHVLRVYTKNASLIVKQSRDYVEKYPQIYAPPTRVQTEGAFYMKIAQNAETSRLMPKALNVDRANNILVLEDVGDSEDYTFLYNHTETIRVEELQSLCSYLSALHRNFSASQADPIFVNQEMRELNHQHIFIYPFWEDNGFDLNHIQPGLQSLAMPYKQDVLMKGRIAEIGKRYLGTGKYLLHGDFYPGSWLKTNEGIKVIDPEFCHYGNLEFDLAIFIAHLHLSNQEKSTIDQALNAYALPYDRVLLNQYVGIEIMRRLIGLAQLPLELTLDQKSMLLSKAYLLITSPKV